MRQYRLSKYDPAFRDDRGWYTRDEWTFFAQVGTNVDRKLLTIEEYEAVEAAYIRVVCALVDAASIGPFIASDFQLKPSWIREGDRIANADLPSVIRSLLREEYWCHLTDDQGHFIHSGWDFYLYLGLPDDLHEPEVIAREEGLFLEPFGSPYHPECE